MYRDLAKEYVRRFCETAVEGTMEMMMDIPDEYSNFSDAKRTLEASLDNFDEMVLDDYLNDFCKEVRELLSRRRVKILEVSFDEEGFKNCEYTIEVEESADER